MILNMSPLNVLRSVIEYHAKTLLRYFPNQKQGFIKVSSQAELEDGEKQAISLYLSISRSEDLLQNLWTRNSASGWQGTTRAIFLSIIIPLAVSIQTSVAQSSKFDSADSVIPNRTDTTSAQLQKYLEIAAENSPKLQVKYYKYRAVLEQAPQAGALPNPKVMFKYFINPRNYVKPFSRMTVSLSQHFPWFGTLKAAQNKVQELAKAKAEAIINSRNKLFKKVKDVWFRIYEMKHHIRILGEHIELLQKLESRALTFYKTGQTSQTDVLRLQMETDRVNSRLKQQKAKLTKYQVQFNKLLNRKSHATIRTPMPMPIHRLAFTSQQILHKVKSGNPKLVKLYFRKQAAHYSLKKARRNGLPSFSVGVSAMLPNYMYMTMMPGNRTAFVGRLSISIPIFRSQYKAQKKQAKLIIKSIDQQRHQLINKLTSKVAKWLQKYHDAQYRINLYGNKLIPKTRQALSISIENYSTGKGDFEELFRLQEQILKYKMKLRSAYVEANIAIANIEYLYGKYNVERSKISK